MVQPAVQSRKVYEKVTFFIAAMLLLPAAITLFFVVEVAFGLRKGPGETAIPTSQGRATIVIPAHDEEAVLGPTLASLIQALPENADILVIPDNCTDDTATIARAQHVRVAERHDLQRRGKGFALDHARSVLASEPPAVVVVVDADCIIERSDLHRLIAGASSGRPSQAINLLRPVAGGSPMVQISTFAFMLKNVVRQRGLQQLAGRVHLTGTGMALPWDLFAKADLATSSIVEDIRLGFELSERGSPPRLVEDAVIWSSPSTEGGTLVQRKRWEGGFLEMARGTAPSALLNALRRLDTRGFAAALDLCVPPLALLGLINLTLLVGTGLLTWLTSASWWPVSTFIALIGLMGAVVLAAWAKEGRAFLPARVLLRIPLYLLWKLPMYLGLGKRGAPSEWLRTGR